MVESEKNEGGSRKPQKNDPVPAMLHGGTAAITKTVENILEGQPRKLDIPREVTNIAMLFNEGNSEMFSNEAVVQLAMFLEGKPITKQLLRYIGVKTFTLNHEDLDVLEYIDFIIEPQKQWVRIDTDVIPQDVGLPFDVEKEIGDELRGTLVHDEHRGFCLCLHNDKNLHPLDVAALAALESRGGAAAFLNTEMIVRVEVSDEMRLTAL